MNISNLYLLSYLLEDVIIAPTSFCCWLEADLLPFKGWQAKTGEWAHVSWLALVPVITTQCWAGKAGHRPLHTRPGSTTT